jgi:hypothetical protein
MKKLSFGLEYPRETRSQFASASVSAFEKGDSLVCFYPKICKSISILRLHLAVYGTFPHTSTFEDKRVDLIRKESIAGQGVFAQGKYSWCCAQTNG